MRILLDECVPGPLHRLLINHSCFSVQGEGWAGIRNGDLLQRITRFDVFITADQNIQYQQNLVGTQIAILELSTNDLRRINASSQLILETLDKLQPGEFRRLVIP